MFSIKSKPAGGYIVILPSYSDFQPRALSCAKVPWTKGDHVAAHFMLSIRKFPSAI